MSDTIKVRPVMAGYTTAGLYVGEQVSLWGHTFTVEKNRTLTCDMPVNLARVEIKAGRVVPIVALPPEEKHSLDVSDYYGAGSAEAFKKRISEMTIFELQKYTNDRLKTAWPKTMTKEAMVEKFCETVAELRGE